MNSRIRSVLLSFFVFSASHLYAQDYLYFGPEIKSGRVLSITPTNVIYRDLSQNVVRSADIHTVTLMFNKRGNYLVPAKMDFANPQTQDYISAYMDSVSPALGADQIFLDSKKCEEDSILSETDKVIMVQSPSGPRKIEKKSLAVVIYRKGGYKFYGSLNNTVKVLSSSLPVANGFFIAQKVRVAAAATAVAKAKPPVDTTSKTVKDINGDILSREDFQKKSDSKIKLFTSYLKLLCDKSAGYEEKNNAIEQATNLFIDGAKIETSSVNSDNKAQYLVRDYLENLKSLHYDHIDIQWTRVEYVSNIRLGTDKKYHGSITFTQIFRGYKDGKKVYEDVTTKTAEVEMKAYDRNFNGQQSKEWDVMLSDIEVQSTKSS